jgi:hypothetical protein
MQLKHMGWMAILVLQDAEYYAHLHGCNGAQLAYGAPALFPEPIFYVCNMIACVMLQSNIYLHALYMEFDGAYLTDMRCACAGAFCRFFLDPKCSDRM